MRSMAFKYGILIIVCLMMGFLMTGCGSSGSGDPPVVPGQEDETDDTGEGGEAGPVSRIIGTAGSDEIIADGESEAKILVQLYDSEDKAVRDGTIVSFDTSAGVITGSAVTKNGRAEATLKAGTNLGTAKITIESQGITNIVEVEFVAGPPGQGNLFVVPTPASLTADGGSISKLRIMALDKFNNPVDDETVTVSALAGVISNPTPLVVDGSVEINYTAPSYVPATGSDTVTVRSTNGVEATALITLLGSQIAGITLEVNPTNLPADGFAVAQVNATLTLAGGGSVPDGTPVIFTRYPEIGSIGQKATTAGGIAVATYTAGTIPGKVTIRAEAGGKVAESQVELTPGKIEIGVIPNSLLGTGQQTAQVTATIKDANNIPQANQKIEFILDDVTLGTIPSSAISNESGEAIVTFREVAKGGTVKITARWKSGDVYVTGSDTIAIQPPPGFIAVAAGYPQPAAINIKGTGGQSTSQIMFAVQDSQGQAVADGYRIDFRILSGPDGGEEISPLFAVTKDGKAGTVIRSGFKSGPVSVKATYYYDTNVTTTTSQIAIQAGPPVGEELGVQAQFLNISGLSQSGIEDVITVNAGDIYGNAIPDNTAISFKTYSTGGIFNPGSSTTGGAAGSGFATNSLYSVSNPSPAQGFVSVTAEAVNGGRTTHVTCIEVVKENDSNQILYAGTDGGGVYKSLDSGATWSNISRSSRIPGQNWINPYVNDIAVDPDNPNVLYAATGFLGQGQLYRSLDSGLNWNSNNVEEFLGVFQVNGAILTVLADDDKCDSFDCKADKCSFPYYDVFGTLQSIGDLPCYRYVWVGTQGYGAWYSTDGKHFQQEPGTLLGQGTTVNQIVKVPDTHGASAHLYAGTATGLYKSNDGGKTWVAKTPFSGNYITKLVIHPSSNGGANDVIYAGTEDAGFWVSIDSGNSWQTFMSGLGKGLSASTPVADLNNKGTGQMDKVTALPGCESENWTVTCIAENPNGGWFSVLGSISGALPNYNIENGEYTAVTGGVQHFKMTVKDGDTDFKVGDKFTFRTTRDEGRKVQDILLDHVNNRLYIVTYFWGALEPHAVGNIYTVQINGDGDKKPMGSWVEANAGLPQYDAPADTTLFAQHAIALDDPGYPRAIFTGGEGINFHKSITGLDNGQLSWFESKSGMTNLIMARMPVLFSGAMSMSVNTFTSPLNADETRFVIYVQDINGNPPVGKSKLRAVDNGYDPPVVIIDITYSDSLVNNGTFRDRKDPRTDIPIYFDYELESWSKVKITFTYGDTAATRFTGDL